MEDLPRQTVGEKSFECHGQGLLWGGELQGVKMEELRSACSQEAVWPYLVPGPPMGFMCHGSCGSRSSPRITPPMDIDETQFREGVAALARVVGRLLASQ